MYVFSNLLYRTFFKLKVLQYVCKENKESIGRIMTFYTIPLYAVL